MMSKATTRHTVQERWELVQLVIEKHRSVKAIAKQAGISPHTLKMWIIRYQAEGIEGLETRAKHRSYSPELKRQVVEEYLQGGVSKINLCQKYQISSISMLSKWIHAYTQGKPFITKGRGSAEMKQGRKTTWEERIEIAQYAIAHEEDFTQTAAHYQVSYQQVYTWVQKYKQSGKEGLIDRRGKSLDTKEQLTEVEQLQLRLKEVEHRNAYLEAERGLLKKLEAIERRRRRS